MSESQQELKHKEDELEKMLFHIYEQAVINKVRIIEGNMTDLEVMNYQSAIIMQTKKAIVNLFEGAYL